MRNLSKKAKTIIAGAAIAGLASTGVAYAYWTTTGSGVGGATAGAPVVADKIELVQSSTITGLYPGGPAADIMVTAHNPAAFDQVVGQVTVIPSYPGACDTPNWTLVPVTNAFGNVGHGATHSALKVGTIKLNETGANQDLCQGVSPTFAFSSLIGQ